MTNKKRDKKRAKQKKTTHLVRKAPQDIIWDGLLSLMFCMLDFIDSIAVCTLMNPKYFPNLALSKRLRGIHPSATEYSHQNLKFSCVKIDIFTCFLLVSLSPQMCFLLQLFSLHSNHLFLLLQWQPPKLSP